MNLDTGAMSEFYFLPVMSLWVFVCNWSWGGSLAFDIVAWVCSPQHISKRHWQLQIFPVILFSHQCWESLFLRLQDLCGLIAGVPKGPLGSTYLAWLEKRETMVLSCRRTGNWTFLAPPESLASVMFWCCQRSSLGDHQVGTLFQHNISYMKIKWRQGAWYRRLSWISIERIVEYSYPNQIGPFAYTWAYVVIFTSLDPFSLRRPLESPWRITDLAVHDDGNKQPTSLSQSCTIKPFLQAWIIYGNYIC